ncbi:tetratricopeptide repeat protein [Psychroflexus aestuariivivens]|uniref:tetratricopeptide repeat protein n=1 Tax=Psychroflexus aestuariivivens TaxID=1795040 RepID=UPI000FDACB17|nr:tetratricopeptide repeat protein [Psychroflexus aestuariivivens]
MHRFILLIYLLMITSCKNTDNSNNIKIISESPYIYYILDENGMHYFDERFQQNDTISEISNSGREYIFNNEIEKAENQINEGLKIDSLDPILNNDLANIYKKDKKFEKSIIHYNKAIKISDSIYIPPLINLADLYATLGEQSKSEKIYFYIINNNKSEIYQGIAFHGLANMYYKYGYIDKARSNLKTGKKLVQKDKNILKKFTELEVKINQY